MNQQTIQILESYVLLEKPKEELIKIIHKSQNDYNNLIEKHGELYNASREREQRKDLIIEEYKLRLHYADLANEKYKQRLDLELGNDYNPEANRIDKIVFVLQAAKRPLLKSEICEILSKHDRKVYFLEDIKKTISVHLARAVKSGRILTKPLIGRNLNEYFLPENDK